MDIDSTTTSPGVISQFKITDSDMLTYLAKTEAYKANKKAIDDLVDLIKGGDETASGKLFAWCLFNVPRLALEFLLEPKPTTPTSTATPKTKAAHVAAVASRIPTMQKLFSTVKPTDVKSFVELLPSGERQMLRESILYAGKKTYADVPLSELVEKLKKSKALVEFLRGQSTQVLWTAPQIDVNPYDGLNLLLLQPSITQVVMEKRKKDAELMLARATPLVSGVMGPVGPEVFLRLSSSMSGGANLDPSIPIDMRGAGPIIASMKAGFFNGLAIGTGNSPTQWRPVSDVIFISGQLRAAYNTLLSRIEKITGREKVLSKDVNDHVKSVIDKLEQAEKDVKETRDQLTKYNEIIASGQSSLSKNSRNGLVDLTNLKQSVKLYNDAQTLRNRYEQKIFRVISTLGLKLESLSY